MEFSIPDSIEPVYGFRWYTFYGGHLLSLYGDSYDKFLQTFGEKFVLKSGRYSLLSFKPKTILPAICTNSKPCSNPPSSCHFKTAYTNFKTGSSCGCGYYSATSFLSIEKYAGPDRVLAVVKSWGKIFEHEFGYRSQFQYPVEFLVCEKYMEKDLVEWDLPISLKSPYYKEMKDWVDLMSSKYNINLKDD